MIWFVILSLIGVAMMFALPNTQPRARLAGFCFTVAYVANFPLSLSLVTSNVKGFTKKSTIMAMVFVAYCVGNIAGPQFFLAREAPHYPVRIPCYDSAFVETLITWYDMLTSP